MDESRPRIPPSEFHLRPLSKRTSADIGPAAAEPAKSDELVAAKGESRSRQIAACRNESTDGLTAYYRNEEEVREGFLIALGAMGVAVVEQRPAPAKPRSNGKQRRKITIAAALFLLGANDMSNHAIGFDSARIGTAPDGWTATLTGSGDPKWTVENDETAPSKSKVLKQSGRAAYPLLLKNDSNIKDGFVEIKFKAIAGSQDRSAGIVWRAKDANNYYVTRANALENNVVLYKTVNGVRSPLDIVGRKGGYGTNVKVPANIWHSLRVDFNASRFRVSFNGKQLFEVEDSTFADAGKIGLWTKADSVTLFDQIIYDETK